MKNSDGRNLETELEMERDDSSDLYARCEDLARKYTEEAALRLAAESDVQQLEKQLAAAVELLRRSVDGRAFPTARKPGLTQWEITTLDIHDFLTAPTISRLARRWEALEQLVHAVQSYFDDASDFPTADLRAALARVKETNTLAD